MLDDVYHAPGPAQRDLLVREREQRPCAPLPVADARGQRLHRAAMRAMRHCVGVAPARAGALAVAAVGAAGAACTMPRRAFIRSRAVAGNLTRTRAIEAPGHRPPPPPFRWRRTGPRAPLAPCPAALSSVPAPSRAISPAPAP